MTVACIVQARMGSKRFPGKIMANLNGHPVLWHVLSRCALIPGIDKFILATPKDSYAVGLGLLALEMGFYHYAGDHDENDVLSRYLGAAKRHRADIIMRITADCPRIAPNVCGQVLAMVNGIVQYACNFMPIRTFEKGLDCEAFTMRALELADKNTKGADREHVTPWLYGKDSTVAQAFLINGRPERAETNWCIDTPEDLERLQCA